MRLFLLIAFLGCTARVPEAVQVPNLHRVRANVWRSGQPETLDHWRQVRAIVGEKTRVLKLNCESEGSDAPARLVGFEVVDLCIEPRTDPADVVDVVESVFEKPNAAAMARLIAELRSIPTVDDGRRWLIHCVHGRDRTGTAVAMARVVVDGYSKRVAWDEAKAMGLRWWLFVGLERYFWGDFDPLVGAKASNEAP